MKLEKMYQTDIEENNKGKISICLENKTNKQREVDVGPIAKAYVIWDDKHPELMWFYERKLAQFLTEYSEEVGVEGTWFVWENLDELHDEIERLLDEKEDRSI